MMTSLEKAVQTQLVNIQKKTGMSLKELAVFIKKSGLSKHGEIRDMLKEKLGLGHGDANALVHAVFESDGTRAAQGKSEETIQRHLRAPVAIRVRLSLEKNWKAYLQQGQRMNDRLKTLYSFRTFVL